MTSKGVLFETVLFEPKFIQGQESYLLKHYIKTKYFQI
jgi:hypothetical protein